MDKSGTSPPESGTAVCTFFTKRLCEKGEWAEGSCDRSGTTRGEKPVVCKKGDQCKFLHQNDVARMPKCHFSFKSGDCSNKERPFLHVKPAFKTQDCPGDDRGFCKHGPLCKSRHVRRTKCTNYLKLAPARKDPGTNLHIPG